MGNETDMLIEEKKRQADGERERGNEKYSYR